MELSIDDSQLLIDGSSTAPLHWKLSKNENGELLLIGYEADAQNDVRFEEILVDQRQENVARAEEPVERNQSIFVDENEGAVLTMMQSYYVEEIEVELAEAKKTYVSFKNKFEEIYKVSSYYVD